MAIYKNIGLTTGFSYKQIEPLAIETIKRCGQISSGAIEINCISDFDEKMVLEMDNISTQDMAGFKFVTLHAPCMNKYYNNDLTIKILDKIQETCDRLNVHSVVFHSDRIFNWDVFRHYSFPMAIENLDVRKEQAKSAEQLQKVFDLIDCKFVLDVNHCFSIDPTMKLAYDLLDKFKDRLCEIHVSGFYDKYHYPIYKTQQNEILDAIPDMDIPIIIESCCADWNEAQLECDYIRNYLKK